jgi:hypothetical protein
MPRYFLVNYTNVVGEYEFSSKMIIVLAPKQKIGAAVHKYFMGYYGTKPTEVNKTNYYLYNSGEVGVKRIGWRDIPKEDALVLQRYGI